MISKNCCICLKEAETLKPINCEDPEVTLKGKLEYVAPELKWLEILFICPECNVQLNNAYDFKQLCFTYDSFRMDAKHAKFNDAEDNSSVFSEEVIKDESLCNIEESNETKLMKIELFNQNVNNLRIHQKTFNIKKNSRINRKTQHPDRNLSKFQCEICGEHFSLLKNILGHCVAKHSMARKDIKPYRCNYCNNKFASSSSLVQHKKYHKGDRKFVCSVCGKSFITRRDLNGHEKLHDNQRNYSCDKCDKSFNTSQNLKTHVFVVHTDSSQWKHSCPVCSKRFAMKANWNEHVKRHQGSKDFVCHICKKTFVSNHEVKKHVRLHSNIAPFGCDHCEKHYRDRRSLDIHLSKAHGIGTVKNVRVKKFVCHICPSQFFDNQKLQRHIRTHTGIKPFSCHECDKTFIDKSYLTHHLKTVHNFIAPVKTEESPHKYV